MPRWLHRRRGLLAESATHAMPLLLPPQEPFRGPAAEANRTVLAKGVAHSRLGRR